MITEYAYWSFKALTINCEMEIFIVQLANTKEKRRKE